MRSTIKWLLVLKISLLVVILFMIKGYFYLGDRPLEAEDQKNNSEINNDNDNNQDLKSIIELPKIDYKKASASELENYILTIDKKKAELESKAKLLKEREDILTKMEASIDTKLKKIENEKQLFLDSIQKEEELSKERKKELVEFYKKMPAKKAAVIFSNMNMDLVVALFKELPQKQVSSILSEMSSEKSKEVTEYFSRIDSLKEYSVIKNLKQAIENEFEGCNVSTSKQK